MITSPPEHYLRYRSGPGYTFDVVFNNEVHQIELLFTEQQLQEAASVERAAFRSNIALDVDYLELIARHGFVLGKRNNNGGLIGVAEVVITPVPDAAEEGIRTLQPNEAYFEGLAVLHNAAGGGVASVLTSGVECLARNAGKDVIKATASPNNRSSLSILVRAGYVGESVDPKYYDIESDYESGARLKLSRNLNEPVSVYATDKRFRVTDMASTNGRLARREIRDREAEVLQFALSRGQRVVGVDAFFDLGGSHQEYFLNLAEGPALDSRTTSIGPSVIRSVVVPWEIGDDRCLKRYGAEGLLKGVAFPPLDVGSVVAVFGQEMNRLGDLYWQVEQLDGEKAVVRRMSVETNALLVDSGNGPCQEVDRSYLAFVGGPELKSLCTERLSSSIAKEQFYAPPLRFYNSDGLERPERVLPKFGYESLKELVDRYLVENPPRMNHDDRIMTYDLIVFHGHSIFNTLLKETNPQVLQDVTNFIDLYAQHSLQKFPLGFWGSVLTERGFRSLCNLTASVIEFGAEPFVGDQAIRDELLLANTSRPSSPRNLLGASYPAPKALLDVTGPPSNGRSAF